ncbi:unnamed protein product [Didymodactylos carnosus]|uniref:TIMELESS-interacting protein n=1 Tax=Didymodactylos carnosus TaxID=1234261 RepID=A0A813QDB0_9BILA|nr:unnamed protein product [Didymodactylos carnosus]CAF0821225.1 unnamed protein product [Didymodactylos carnosus]CAF3547384.1 unnamed protein product [Didymodactylos carnosus]CAF3605530.1 unnamed protein product [Didymodactylos carnosus]
MDIDLINDLMQLQQQDDSDPERSKLERNDDDPDDENNASINDNVDNLMKKANETAKKKVVRRPRPKLDVDRLVGPKGLENLCDLFKNETFKGKGYEASLVLFVVSGEIYEYWAHRLVPHMAFDDFIEKAEKLGNKKPIKVIMT